MLQDSESCFFRPADILSVMFNIELPETAFVLICLYRVLFGLICPLWTGEKIVWKRKWSSLLKNFLRFFQIGLFHPCRVITVTKDSLSIQESAVIFKFCGDIFFLCVVFASRLLRPIENDPE